MADTGLNVKDFGAMGDGKSHPLSTRYSTLEHAKVDYPHATSLHNQMDWTAIQAAIEAARSEKCPTVYIPPGRYRLDTALKPEVDNLTLCGSVGTVLIADPADGESFPGAILVNKGPMGAPSVEHLRIQNLRIEVLNGAGGEASVGVIQLNNCTDCMVINVQITYTGAAHKPKPKNIDGIATSQGTTGVLQGCVIDGIPKVGIYISQDTHDLRLEACEVKNTLGPLGQVGISIAGSRRITIHHCLSYNNGDAGLLIGVNGPIGTAPPTPARDIQVVGGTYHSNTRYGILIGGPFDGLHPENIQLVDVAAVNNDGRGISIEAGSNITIANSTVVDNGLQGIWVDNTPIGPSKPRTTLVQITNVSNIFNNGRKVRVAVPGIGLRAANRVTITGGKLFTTALMKGRQQQYGIGLYKNKGGDISTDVQITDIDGSFDPESLVVPIDVHGLIDVSAATQYGYYRLQGRGAPEGVLAAPIGSEYLDLLTGMLHRKATGSGPGGWKLVHRFCYLSLS